MKQPELTLPGRVRGIAGILCCWGVAQVTVAQVNVTTHHNDNARTGANLQETILTPANVKPGLFGKLYSVKLDGQVYTQPLYVSNLTIPGNGSHNVVFVATMNNSVYALDADNGGAQLWEANVGPPVHPCDVEWHENITQGSSVGILGTPVIDRSTNTIYFVSRNETQFDRSRCNWAEPGISTGLNQGVFTQQLNALDITTGAPKFGSPVKIAATFESADGTLTFDPRQENQRAALTLANGHIYIPYASHDDLADYHGWILSYVANTLVQDHVYSDTTASGAKGGIWQAGNGMTVDGAGSLYVSTGNGDFEKSAGGFQQTGNSFVKLSPSLSPLDWFTPSNSDALNAQDEDLGSSGVLAIPGTTLIWGGGKQGFAYLVNTASMGKFSPSTDNVVQEFQAILGHGTAHIHGTPIYFNSPTAGPLLLVWGENDFLRSFSFNAANPKAPIQRVPVAMSTMTAPETNNNGAMPGGFMSISANGNANGIIWASTPFNADASQATVQGVLHAFDATTLQELWNDKLDARDEIGNFAKFVPPTVANGKVFVPNFGPLNSADGSGSLNVYGLIAGGTAHPPLVANGTYKIVSRFSGLTVDDPGSSSAANTIQQQWTINGGANQQWQLTNVGLNVVSLVNGSSGLALEVAGASTANGAFVDQNRFTGSRSQLWTVTAVAGGFFTLTNVNSGQVLDVDGGTTTPGTQLDQFPYQGNPWQQWSFQ